MASRKRAAAAPPAPADVPTAPLPADVAAVPPPAAPAPPAAPRAGERTPKKAARSRSAPARATTPRASTARGSAARAVAGRPGPRKAALPTLPDASVTDELRATLDDLRKVLDDASAAPVPPSRRGRRRAVVLLVCVAALTAGVVGVSAATGWGPLFGPPEGVVADDTTGSTDLSPALPTTPVPGDEPPLRPWPGQVSASPADAAASGPGVDAAGTTMVASVVAGDELEVYERAVLTAAADTLTLTLPALSQVDGLTVELPLSVEDLQVSVDGRTVPAVEDGAGQWVVRAPRGEDISAVELRYRLAGAVVEVTPSTTGRALVALTPLTAVGSGAAGHGVQVALTDASVLGITCPTAPVADQLCGTVQDGRWTAMLPDSALAPLLLAQADLGPRV